MSKWFWTFLCLFSCTKNVPAHFTYGSLRIQMRSPQLFSQYLSCLSALSVMSSSGNSIALFLLQQSPDFDRDGSLPSKEDSETQHLKEMLMWERKKCVISPSSVVPSNICYEKIKIQAWMKFDACKVSDEVKSWTFLL